MRAARGQEILPPPDRKFLQRFQAVRREAGRDDRDFTWERTDKADALRAAAGSLVESRV